MDSHYQYEFTFPVKINAGHKALEHIPFELAAFNAAKPLVVTSKDMTARGQAAAVAAAFADSGMTAGIYDGVPLKPDVKLIRELAGLYRDKGFDAVIGLGAAAVADTAKVLNIVISGGPAYLADAAGEGRVPGPLRPFFMVPAGPLDGREISRFAELDGREYTSHYLMPDLVVIDPRLMIEEPPAVTAASAMTALAQAVDACFGAQRNPLTDAYGTGALQIIGENMDPIIRNPKDRTARLALVNACCFAGCAFSNLPTGITYRLGRTVAEVGRLSPGLCMGTVLPSSVTYYGHTGDVANRVAETMAAMRRAGMGYRSLKEAGFPEDALRETARKAAAADYSEDTCFEVLRKAWSGETGF